MIMHKLILTKSSVFFNSIKIGSFLEKLKTSPSKIRIKFLKISWSKELSMVSLTPVVSKILIWQNPITFTLSILNSSHKLPISNESSLYRLTHQDPVTINILMKINLEEWGYLEWGLHFWISISWKVQASKNRFLNKLNINKE